MEKQSKGKYLNFTNDDFHHIVKSSRVDLSEVLKTKEALKNSLKKVIFYIYYFF